MIKTFKYRLVPTRKQGAALQQTLDLCRNLYNCALEQRRMQHVGQFAQRLGTRNPRQASARRILGTFHSITRLQSGRCWQATG
jgi:hypothetical protein